MFKIYDSNILFIKCGSITENELNNVIHKSIEKYNLDNTPIFSQWKINVVSSLKSAFVFFDKVEICNLLLGKNLDGTDRVSYIDAINQKRKIQIFLEPLITFPNYKLTDEEQIEYGRDSSEFNFQKAEIKPVDPKYVRYILKSMHVPQWVTSDDIKKKFELYVSDKQVKVNRHSDNKIIKESYPLVNINKDGFAFVTFNEHSNDAQRALLIQRHTKFSKMINGKLFEIVLSFVYSYETSRDKENKQIRIKKRIQKENCE